MAALTKYYVYKLIDPRDGSTFYVGKGCGKRVCQHERDAKLRKFYNSGKEARIHAIWAAGLQVVHEIVSRHDSESAAYMAERSLIAAIGIRNLENLCRGSDPAELKAKRAGLQFITDMRERMPSFSPQRAALAQLLIAEMKEAIAVCDKRLGFA